MDTHTPHPETTHQSRTPPTHTDPASPPHAGAGALVQAARATLHCLTGCAIGEVLGLVIGTALGLSTGVDDRARDRPGLRLRLRPDPDPVLRSGVALKAALAVTLAADTVSITVMEVVDNSVMLARPGRDGRRARDRPVLGRARRSRSPSPSSSPCRSTAG